MYISPKRWKFIQNDRSPEISLHLVTAEVQNRVRLHYRDNFYDNLKNYQQASGFNKNT